MSISPEEIYQQLADAVVEMDEEQAVAHAQTVIAQHHDPYAAIDQGLSKGMERAGELFEEEEYFIPELLICSDAMYAGLNVLRPHLPIRDDASKGRVIIGVVEGDTHDIGKNLVKIMLETAGFAVTDLGRDIPPAQFVETAKAQQADIIALSTLMTTTMDGMAEVIRILQREDLRDRFKVIVGGGPISQAFADRIGADGYAVNAAEAAKLATQLLAAKAALL